MEDENGVLKSLLYLQDFVLKSHVLSKTIITSRVMSNSMTEKKDPPTHPIG